MCDFSKLYLLLKIIFLSNIYFGFCSTHAWYSCIRKVTKSSSFFLLKKVTDSSPFLFNASLITPHLQLKVETFSGFLQGKSGDLGFRGHCPQKVRPDYSYLGFWVFDKMLKSKLSLLNWIFTMIDLGLFSDIQPMFVAFMSTIVSLFENLSLWFYSLEWVCFQRSLMW